VALSSARSIGTSITGRGDMATTIKVIYEDGVAAIPGPRPK
jgi:hypothetical protein